MLSLTSAAVVAAVALLAPLAVGLARLRVPEIVLQIFLGILVGPQVLGWAGVDGPVHVLSVLGLGFLLLLSGLEVDVAALRSRVLGVTSAAFLLSFALALLAGPVLDAAGLVYLPLLMAVILSATSLGIVLPPLEDAGQVGTAFGRVVVAGASVAEVVPVVLLSVLFSADAAGIGSRLALLVTFLGFVLAVALLIAGVERSARISRTLLALQETTAEIRVRGAVTLLMVLAAVAAAIRPDTYVALVAAGLLSVLVLPPLAVPRLATGPPSARPTAEPY